VQVYASDREAGNPTLDPETHNIRHGGTRLQQVLLAPLQGLGQYCM
jgi:hypothetical protein